MRNRTHASDELRAAHAPPSRRFVTRDIVVAIALVAVAALLWLNRQVLVLAFGALVFSTVIISLAELLRFVHVRGRWAVGLAVLLLVGALGALFWMFGVRLADQIAQLQQALPDGLAGAQRWVATLPHGDRIVAGIKHTVANGGMAKIAAVAQIATTALANIVLIAFAALYFALDPDLYRRGVVRLVPLQHRDRVVRALRLAAEALTKWVRAQLLLMLAVGTATGIGLAIVGVPLTFSLAVIIGLFEFIPLLGPILGAIPGILLAFTQGPRTAFYALLVYLVVQQLENNVLTPVVQRWAVQLPPILGLFSVLAAGLTFGFLGVVFATPMALVAMVLLRQLYVEPLEHDDPDAAGRSRRSRHGPPAG